MKLEALRQLFSQESRPFRHRKRSLRVITFYSWKGGVGRSMALANVAFRLANRHAQRVIAVDWDLEAPGLPRFFGFSEEQLAQAPGILDFLIAWREGVQKKAGPPPDVRKWLIEVKDSPYKPAHGSLSILTAGRQDKEYGARLASFDWRPFYKESSGSTAIERLRRQLVESADIVLVDSRTGLTDAGGICTVQLPDGVVLMTVPNEQSLYGTERVARAIRDPEAKRGGRERPTVWLSVCRVPILEEQQLVDAWFKDHRAWFEEGIKAELWAREDHPKGLRSHVLPHRGRWALGEQLVREEPDVGGDDPLVAAYDALTAVLFTESEVGQASREDTPVAKADPIEVLRAHAKEAEQRGDIPGLMATLVELGDALHGAYRFDEAAGVLERAAGMYLASGDRRGYGKTQLMLGYVRLDQRRIEDARALGEQALAIRREVADRGGEAKALYFMGIIAHEQGDFDAAESWYRRSLAVDEQQGDVQGAATSYFQLGVLAHERKDFAAAETWYRKSLAIDEIHQDGQNAASTYHRLGMLAHDQQDFAAAEAWHRKSLAIDEKLGHEHGAAFNCFELGVLAGLQARFEEAAQWLVRSIISFTRTNDPRSAREATSFLSTFNKRAPAEQQAKIMEVWNAAGLGEFPSAQSKT